MEGIQLSGDFLGADGARVGFILFAGFVLSFGFIRFSTRMIRKQVSWWPGNIDTGGVHVHHMVFGIVLLLLCGFLNFALDPQAPWVEVLAAGFGIGAGLTLDEFALWLHLEDVYWADRGRQSIEATAIAVAIAAMVLLGVAPFDVQNQEGDVAVFAGVVIVNLLLVADRPAQGQADYGRACRLHSDARLHRRHPPRAPRVALGQAPLQGQAEEAREGHRARPQVGAPAAAPDGFRGGSALGARALQACLLTMRPPSTRVVAAVVFGAMALTVVHFTDNAVNVDEYPKAGWQPDWFEWVVVAGWFVYSAIGVAGFRFYREGRLPAAQVCLVVYGLAVASSLAHFLYGSPGEMPTFSAVSVFIDLAAGLAVIAVGAWSALASAPAGIRSENRSAA